MQADRYVCVVSEEKRSGYSEIRAVRYTVSAPLHWILVRHGGGGRAVITK